MHAHTHTHTHTHVQECSSLALRLNTYSSNRERRVIRGKGEECVGGGGVSNLGSLEERLGEKAECC